MFGKAATANLGHEKNTVTDYLHFTSVIFSDITLNECVTLVKQVALRFGEPAVNDGSFLLAKFSETNYVRVHRMSYQWDLGSTRVNSVCFGSVTPTSSGDKDRGFLLSILFSHQSRLPKLVPQFSLQCTREVDFNDGAAPREMDDLLMNVNLYAQHITSAGEEIISRGLVSGDESIEFSLDGTEGFVTAYKINRMTGRLRGEVSKDGQFAAYIRGSCEKSAIEKKF